jgi:hypothetical protein
MVPANPVGRTVQQAGTKEKKRENTTWEKQQNQKNKEIQKHIKKQYSETLAWSPPIPKGLLDMPSDFATCL